MTVLQCVLCVLFAGFAASYGWGMRGTVIGGEKGAMLPGMLIGLSLALFSGGALAQYFWIPAAAGLIGMTFGGIEPYGDTISFVVDIPPQFKHDLKKGLTGLALKGGLWFSLCGGIIGMAISAMGGRYTAAQLILFCLICPIAQFAFYNLFNTPVDPDNKIMPKISFSFESREEWGSNVGIFIVLLVFGIFAKDALSLTLLLFGFVFGAVGWLIAIFNFYFTVHPMKNGKYLFGKTRLYEGGWGFMEYTLGAVGGIGIALGFVLQRKNVAAVNAAIEQNGLFSPLGGRETLVAVIMAVIFLCLFLVNFIGFRMSEKGRKVNNFISDIIERPFFNLIPLIFVLLCSLTAARLMTVFMLIYALALKVCFDRFEKDEHRGAMFALFFGVSILVFALDILLGGFSPFWLFFAGGIPYWVTELLYYGMHKKFNIIKFLTDRYRGFDMRLMLYMIIIINVLSFFIV